MTGILSLGLGLACDRVPEPVETTHGRPGRLEAATARSGSHSPGASRHPLPITAEPEVVLTLGVSAYAASLATDERAVYLLTSDTVFRLERGQKPVEIQVDNGTRAALTHSSLVYWSRGWVRSVSKTGGRSKQLVRQPHQPQFFVGHGESIAWLDQPTKGSFLIQAPEGKGVRTVAVAAGNVAAMTMTADRIVFVEAARDRSWRFGSVRLSGGTPDYSAPRSGRTPAMLVAAGDVFFYDGNTIEVRRMAPDLTAEQTVAKNTVCSPIAVAAHVYCAAFDGIFAHSNGAGLNPVRVYPTGRDVGALVASPEALVWTRDIGRNRLAVTRLPLHVNVNGDLGSHNPL